MQVLSQLSLNLADAILDWGLYMRDEDARMQPEIIGGNPTGRYAIWFGLGVDKSAGIQRHHEWKAYKAHPTPDWMYALAPEGVDFNSVLVYLYSPRAGEKPVGIGMHSDKQIYAEQVTMIHCCRDRRPRELSLLSLLEVATSDRDSTAFKWGMQKAPMMLYHGDVCQFNARIEHGVPPVPFGVDRLTLQFRNVVAK